MDHTNLDRAWVYIVLCSDGSYYVGSTIDIEKRIIDHNEVRYEGYTSSRLPVTLLWSSEFSDIRYAFEYERKIKKWSRAKKEALMKGNYDQLHLLSRSTIMKEKMGIR
jgi:predicted GIY-YIG superfamily endonuclease